MFVLQDTNLKIATLEFIATAVETQPGLIELFLNLKEKEKNSQVKQLILLLCGEFVFEKGLL